MVVDHSWAGDAQDGEHNQASVRVLGDKPTLTGTDGAIYSKVVNGITELFFEDSNGLEVQITSDGGPPPLSWSTGDVKTTLKIVPDTGWVMADDGTLGNAGSAATNRANADTSALYTLLWTNCDRGLISHGTITGTFLVGETVTQSTSGATGLFVREVSGVMTLRTTVGTFDNTHVLTGGTSGATTTATSVFTADCPVSTGRGTTAALDFAALKTIKLRLLLGRALAVSGAGSGLTNRDLARALGEETHVLVTAEIPSHNHALVTSDGSGSSSSKLPLNTPFTTADVRTNFNTLSTGGDGAHNNMQPTAFLNVMVKL